MKRNNVLILVSYISIYLIWGTTYFFISKAVETIPPSWVVGSRFLFGGSFFILLTIFTGQVKEFPKKEEIITSFFLGFFLLIMGNGVVTIAETHVDSYITSLILSTIPLIVAIMNSLFYRTKLNWIQIAGFFVGFTGVALLLYNETPRSIGEFRGIILIFLAISCWAFATSWSKKLIHHSNTFFSTGMQMLFAGVIATVVAGFNDSNFKEITIGISNISFLSTLFLAIVGSAAIGAYNYLLKHEPTNRITSYALVNPVIATLIGVYIGGEAATKYLWPGVFLVLSGLVLMLYLGQRKPQKA